MCKKNATFIEVYNIPKPSKWSEKSCSKKFYLTLELPFPCDIY